jgi:hypothetical protein
MIQDVLRSTRLWTLGGLILLAGSLLLSQWTPSGKAEHSVCFVRQATQMPCPGCGLTRGIAALLKFDLWEAVRKHPLSPLFAAEAFLLWIWWGLVAARRTSLPSSGTINRFLILQAGLLIATWVIRWSTGSFNTPTFW